MFGRNDCNPSCADGHYTYTPITVKLLDRAECRGVVAYMRWSIIGAGLDPTPEFLKLDETDPCAAE